MLIASNSNSSGLFFAVRRFALLKIIVASSEATYLAILKLSYCQLCAMRETPEQKKPQP